MVIIINSLQLEVTVRLLVQLEVKFAAFKLIERLFNDYSLNPDYSGGAYLHSAMDGKYESVLKVLELLMDMGANVNYLDIYYNKDHNYLISSLKYINRFMEDKIDIGFFMSGKFTK